MVGGIQIRNNALQWKEFTLFLIDKNAKIIKQKTFINAMVLVCGLSQDVMRILGS